ncbi:hypothetical protein, partial [Citrobacter freundii]|uniref:hypothetical protein n=1 Tax=Citrobacter freundii TaxID=546 RepID=UPI00292C68E6
SVRHIFKPISYLEIQLLSGVSGGYITPKIEAIAYDNELPPVVATEEEYNERLDSLHKVHWHSKLDLLCKKAEENYNWPGIKS